MPKILRLPISLFVAFILMALLISRCDLNKGNEANGIWQKLSRRLFDEDMPSDKAKEKRRYDMTQIGSAEPKSDH